MTTLDDQKSIKQSDRAEYAVNSSLGQPTDYQEIYDPQLLHAILRADYRSTIDDFAVASHGYDKWQCFELSWINTYGLPQVACATVIVDLTTDYIVESKSLKLYFNSFHHQRFDSVDEVGACIKQDLSNVLGKGVSVDIYPSTENQFANDDPYQVFLLDKLDVRELSYTRDANLLVMDESLPAVENEILRSHLLRSVCPITNQPDWGTLTIRYSGPAIQKEGLLRYIVSFRHHDGFHEQCVEQIYSDLIRQCQATHLTVCAQYTRRGGIDINPIRSNHSAPLPLNRLWRQ
ncbi:MAG: NADPH-dependent 7-cyano-7-deazaguanine reductase QueF [Pseudomonadota bacterium]|nr:NADPH-dependent 7-cyano-7-deazaguanine reductase QueF [Pseudomonadota bacterium]